ncbi:kinetochore CENP-C fungal-like protein [Phyllosticta citricarpa]|uniref:Kinetochore CENP-C fungal-like protein n=1 Tax=Phyllosticta citricarpa TaxID=55181 RepID=A0ABR1LKC5_9PEZI
MAPTNSPGRKRRENEYFRVGEQGRKTGVTLAQRERDEHGFEDLDGVFSSPEKSPAKRTTATALDKTLTSEDMDIQQSSMPEPADALSARKSIRPGRNSTFLPPPMGRSPIKTSLGSSPRRQSSMGPPSMRRATRSPDRASSHPAVARKLDFSSIDVVSDQGDSSASRNKSAARRSIYDIEPTPEPEQEPTQADTVVDEEDVPANGTEDESLVPVEDGDTLPVVEEEEDDNVEEPSEFPAARPRKGPGRSRQSLEKLAKQAENQVEADKPAKRAPGRPKKSNQLASMQTANASNGSGSRAGRRNRLATNGDVSGLSATENEKEAEEPSLPEVEETPEKAPRPQPKKRGRPKATAPKTAAEKAQEATESSVQDVGETGVEEVPVPQPKKRGRPKGSGQKTANATKPKQSGAEDEERPAKRTKKDTTTTEAVAKKQPPQRGPKAKPPTAGPSNENPQPVLHRAGSMAPPPPKSNHILRATTPFDDAGVKTTRSGRASIKPLAKYLGERVEYSWDGQNVGIIRADEAEAPKRKRKGSGKGKKRKRASSVSSDEEPELELESWEKGAGIIAGYLNEWDDEKNISIEDGAQQQDIAYAAGKIQTRDVADTEFRYAKIVGTPFMAAGMVDIPPNGIKRKKNSRRMHIVFCVLEGKVTATVGDTQFGINKGGVFVVPRGELSSLLRCPLTPVFSTLSFSTHFPFSPLRSCLHTNTARRNGAAGYKTSIASRCARPRIVRRAVVLCSFLVGGSEGARRRDAARYGSHPG